MTRFLWESENKTIWALIADVYMAPACWEHSASVQSVSFFTCYFYCFTHSTSVEAGALGIKSITLGPRFWTPGPWPDSGGSTLLTQGEWELRTNVLVGPAGPGYYFSCVLVNSEDVLRMTCPEKYFFSQLNVGWTHTE